MSIYNSLNYFLGLLVNRNRNIFNTIGQLKTNRRINIYLKQLLGTK